MNILIDHNFFSFCIYREAYDVIYNIWVPIFTQVNFSKQFKAPLYNESDWSYRLFLIKNP